MAFSSEHSIFHDFSHTRISSKLKILNKQNELEKPEAKKPQNRYCKIAKLSGSTTPYMTFLEAKMVGQYFYATDKIALQSMKCIGRPTNQPTVRPLDGQTCIAQ